MVTTDLGVRKQFTDGVEQEMAQNRESLEGANKQGND